jgi:hypothetical protein
MRASEAKAVLDAYADEIDEASMDPALPNPRREDHPVAKAFRRNIPKLRHLFVNLVGGGTHCAKLFWRKIRKFYDIEDLFWMYHKYYKVMPI